MVTSNIKKSYKLKKGNNKIKIIVKAENGIKRKYIINVYRKKEYLFKVFFFSLEY